MSESSLILGADGGGSKTLGILADVDGTEVARCYVGASNPNVVGVKEAADNLAELLLACCNEAGRSPEELSAAVFGLAGAGNATIKARLLGALETVLQKRGLKMPRTQIESDARIALEGAFGGGPGIIVIAGTGSSVLGKSSEGVITLVGGWGRLLGDEGSGYFVGREALKALATMLDGRAKTSPLRSLLENRFGLGSREGVVNAVYQEALAIPSLAPAVLEVAEQGDLVAADIFRRGAALLAEQLAVLVRLYQDLPRIGVVFVGGLIDHDNFYTRTLRDAAWALSSAVDVAPPLHSPAMGAVLLAQQSLQKR
jgi:N-acetylglucosamine kinase-like BadF-type ATPase